MSKKAREQNDKIKAAGETTPEGMSDQQFGCVKAARALGKQYADRELVNDELKGKLDCKWFGHSGFKISFKDAEEIQRSIYIDIWIDNKDCPEEEKKDCNTYGHIASKAIGMKHGCET